MSLPLMKSIEISVPDDFAFVLENYRRNYVLVKLTSVFLIRQRVVGCVQPSK